MTFPTVAAVNGGGTIVDSNTQTLSLPAGIQAGDLLIAILTVDNTLSNSTLTWPVGWTSLVAKTYDALSDSVFEARYRVADGSEGATFDVTTSESQKSAHTTFRITGQHASTAPVGTSTNGTSTTPDPPSLNPASWDVEDTLWIAVCGHDNGTVLVTAAPSNYTNLREDRGASSTSVGMGTARRELASASEDPGTFTIDTNETWVAATIAIRPAVTVAAARSAPQVLHQRTSYGSSRVR